MIFYNATMDLATAMNCSFDEAAAWGLCAFVVFLSLIGWSFSFFVEFGMNLYPVTKAVFCFIRKNVVKFLRWFRRHL